MSKSVEYQPEIDLERFVADVKTAAGEVRKPKLLDSALRELCKLLLDPEASERCAPVSQVWRLLMGLEIAGSISEDQRYELALQFKSVSQKLYPTEEGTWPEPDQAW